MKIHRGQVFVRAQDPDGNWGTADALDLDEMSFRAFVLAMLVRAELVYSIVEPEGEQVTYKASKVE